MADGDPKISNKTWIIVAIIIVVLICVIIFFFWKKISSLEITNMTLSKSVNDLKLGNAELKTLLTTKEGEINSNSAKINTLITKHAKLKSLVKKTKPIKDNCGDNCTMQDSVIEEL